MNLNDRVKLQLGELLLNNLALAQQVEEANAKVAEMEAKLASNEAQNERPA